MFRSFDYADDLMNTDPSVPSNNPIFRGAAFQQQTTDGVTFNDPGDDRVTFIGDATDPTVELHRSLSLPADVDSTGNSVHGGVVFGPVVQQPNPNMDGNVPARTDAPGSAIPSITGTWYDTLRPNAGYQLPLASDDTYVAVTDDEMGEPYGQHDPLLVPIGEHYVPEKPIQVPSRNSTQPSTEQHPYKLFGFQLGSWEWSGQKAAQERPIADSGPYFEQPLADRLPNPGGAGGAMTDDQAYNLYPQPLTFRAPPTPWDIGPNSVNGFYVDSGT